MAERSQRHSATLDPAPRRSHDTAGDKLREVAKHITKLHPVRSEPRVAPPSKSPAKKLIADAAAKLKKEAE